MSIKLEVGELLDVARSFPNLEAFFVAHPRLAYKLWGQLIERTDLFTSHNRTVEGEYAGSRSKRIKQRNKQIVRLAKQETDGYYDYSYLDIAEKFDLGLNQISKICLEAGFRRRRSQQYAAA